MEQHQNRRQIAIRQYGQRKSEINIPQDSKPVQEQNSIVSQGNAIIVPLEKAAKEDRGEENY